MANYEAVFIEKSSMECMKCTKKIFGVKDRVFHVLEHVSTDTDHKIYSCKNCEFKAWRLSKVAVHCKKHIEDKTKKSDPKEIEKYFEDEMKKNEKVISEMGEACFGSPINVVRSQPIERHNTRGRQYSFVKVRVETVPESAHTMVEGKSTSGRKKNRCQTAFQAVFTSNSFKECLKCKIKIRELESKIFHVFKHVSTDEDFKSYSCKNCSYSTFHLPRIKKHAEMHMTEKEKTNPEMIHEYYNDEMMKNKEVVSEYGVACFGSPIDFVRSQSSERHDTRSRQNDAIEKAITDDEQEQDLENVAIFPDPGDVKMEETEVAEPQSLEMIYPAPERAMWLPTIKDEEVFQQSNRIQQAVVLERNVKNECHWIDLDDDDLDEVQQNHELEVVIETQGNKNRGLVSSSPANPGIFNNYRFQKEWDTEELIVNMRTVGGMLKFSKNVIDLAMDVLRENVMDGASMSYQAENPTEFFKLCPVVIGVRTAITKILQAMGLKEFNG